MAETVSQAELKEMYFYDPIVGVFIRKVKSYQSRHAQIGDFCHNREANGYIRLSFGGKMKMWAHRAAWLYVYGELSDKDKVDHKNGNPWDNSISNLRLCTHAENLLNSKIRKDNKLGFKGVYFHKKSGLWNARVTKDGVTKSLGFYPTPEEASAVREKAARELHGEFYHGLRALNG